MSRVMHCISSLAVGGVENLVLGSLEYFARNGSSHEHVLCAFRGGEYEGSRVPQLRSAGVRCEVIGRTSRFSYSFCRRLRKVADDVSPDVIHAYNTTAALWTRLAIARKKDRRFVVHCGGAGGTGRKWRLIERALLPRSDAFIFNSHSTRATWESLLPIKCFRQVIYNGVSAPGPPESDESRPLPPSPFELLTVCRVAAIKNLSAKVRAVRILHDRGQVDVRLTIVGDGPALEAVRSEARQLGVDHAVSFEGYQPRPSDYHSRAHVFLCTSYSEGLGLALVEAMGNGMVCIAARVGGCSEVIKDEESGFLVECTEPPPDELRGTLPKGQTLPAIVYDYTTGELRPPLGVDPVVLADKISEVRERFDELGSIRRAARKRIIDSFTIDQYCHSLDDFYTRLTQ